MKRIILSRKGFDSTYGKKASPIFNDNKIFSLPIPQEEKSPHKYGDIEFNGINGKDALSEAKVKNYSENDYCHYDPYLNGKEGLFGQVSASQTELENAGVKKDDLFLFFGWFKNYSRVKKDLHHIFGWLQINKILKGEHNIKNFLQEKNILHPHGYKDVSRFKNNTVYVGSKKLIINNKKTNYAGYGYFKKSSKELVLSHANKRSMWQLPKKYFSKSINKNIFINRLEWTDKNNFLVDTNKGPGQEFILDCSENKQLIDWVVSLISLNHKK